jgi:hypothetical protein
MGMAERSAFAKSFQVGGYTCTVRVEFPRFGTGARWTTEWAPRPPTHPTERELRRYRAEYARVAEELAHLLEAERYG